MIASSSYFLICSLLAPQLSFAISQAYPQPQSSASNLTATNTLEPAAVSAGGALRVCVANANWNPDIEHTDDDCEKALFRMEHDIDIYGSAQGIFQYFVTYSHAVFPRASDDLEMPTQYEVGNCVISIFMLRRLLPPPPQPPVFPPSLPFPTDQADSRWNAHDRASFRDLVSEAGYIRSTCPGGKGYSMLGQDNSIGVAIWHKSCRWDMFIKAHLPPIASNGSTTATNNGAGESGLADAGTS